jgi:hypothetical protein
MHKMGTRCTQLQLVCITCLFVSFCHQCLNWHRLHQTNNLASTSAHRNHVYTLTENVANNGQAASPMPRTVARRTSNMVAVDAERRPTMGEPMVDMSEIQPLMTRLCRTVVSYPVAASTAVAVDVIVFCHAHNKHFIRGYMYSNDSPIGASLGYYAGDSLLPRQMSIMQYMSIASTIFQIPGRAAVVDRPNKQQPQPQLELQRSRRRVGVRVLLWGCGTDVAMYRAIVERIGGSLTLLDNSPEWAEKCSRAANASVFLVKHTGTRKSHVQSVTIGADVRRRKKQQHKDYSSSSSSPKNLFVPLSAKDDPFESTELINLPAGVLSGNGSCYDVIVVDGPSGASDMDPGRSQSLYTAVRLAQQCKSDHSTHVFLHDAARTSSIVFANAFLGHDAGTSYIGDTLPRKGLKHWVVAGMNRQIIWWK